MLGPFQACARDPPGQRCWEHQAGSHGEASWPVSSHPPGQVHRAGTLQAYGWERAAGLLLPQAPALMYLPWQLWSQRS